MELLIKKVHLGCFTPETEEIFSFWIHAQLKSGKEIFIDDTLPFDLRQYENQRVDCLIFLIIDNFYVSDISEDELKHPVFHGIYLGEYEIPDKWKIPKPIKLEYDHISNFHAIEIGDDIFLVNPNVLKNYDLKIGDKFTFNTTGLELFAWKPIY